MKKFKNKKDYFKRFYLLDTIAALLTVATTVLFAVGSIMFIWAVPAAWSLIIAAVACLFIMMIIHSMAEYYYFVAKEEEEKDED